MVFGAATASGPTSQQQLPAPDPIRTPLRVHTRRQEKVIAEQTIYFGREHASYVELPIVPR
jgi:hypothetical protein